MLISQACFRDWEISEDLWKEIMVIATVCKSPPFPFLGHMYSGFRW